MAGKTGEKGNDRGSLDRLMAVNGPLCHANKDMLERLVPYNGIEVVTGAKVTGFKDGVLTVKIAGETKEISCESVILSVGYREENSLYHELEFDVPEIYLLGDPGRFPILCTPSGTPLKWRITFDLPFPIIRHLCRK